MATAEARELFKAGQRPGILSRQAGEPFISNISRRRRWYELLKQLDPKPEIQNTLRGELLLDHAKLTQSEKLMIMASTFNNLEFDTVAEALVKRHALASLKSPDTQHKKGKGKGWARSYYGAGEDWNGWYESMPQYDEPETYFSTKDENWQGDDLYAWYAGAENSWDMSWESAEASWYPETAWYGDDSSWNEGPCQDQYEEMAEDYIDETKDAEQVAMEMQAAYLAGEESGDMTTAFKGKGKPHPKEKARATKEKDLEKPKAKGKGYGKGPGKKGYKSRPGELSLEDRRKKLEELKKNEMPSLWTNRPLGRRQHLSQEKSFGTLGNTCRWRCWTWPTGSRWFARNTSTILDGNQEVNQTDSQREGSCKIIGQGCPYLRRSSHKRVR